MYNDEFFDPIFPLYLISIQYSKFREGHGRSHDDRARTEIDEKLSTL